MLAGLQNGFKQPQANTSFIIRHILNAPICPPPRKPPLKLHCIQYPGCLTTSAWCYGFAWYFVLNKESWLSCLCSRFSERFSFVFYYIVNISVPARYAICKGHAVGILIRIWPSCQCSLKKYSALTFRCVVWEPSASVMVFIKSSPSRSLPWMSRAGLV